MTHSYALNYIILKDVFDPGELLLGPPEGWCSFLKSMSEALHVQMYFDPYIIYGETSCPLIEKTVSLLMNFEATKVLMDGSLSNGEPRRARIKLRMAGGGKFIHRNRFQRRNILLSLSGKMWWLFIDSEGGVADQYSCSTSNDDWNGYRSKSLPRMLTVEELHHLAAPLPKGVTAKVIEFSAGDIIAYDGR